MSWLRSQLAADEAGVYRPLQPGGSVDHFKAMAGGLYLLIQYGRRTTDLR